MCQVSSREFDNRVDRFDTLWHSGTVPKIEDFLPPQESPEFNRQEWRNLLSELVMIDLEFRWRRSSDEPTGVGPPPPEAAGPAPDPLPRRPCLEDYLQRYPQLGSWDELPTELIGEEYRVRRRWGDRPTPEDYVKRFRRHGRELLDALRQIDAESQPGQSVGLRVRCPYCNSTIDSIGDAPGMDICCPSCGSHFSLLPGEPETGDGPRPLQVGHFELLQELGFGSFGSVWKARDRELDRMVAVKIPRRTRLDAARAEQFLREARVVAQLNHPNIVAVHEVGREGETVFIVTDFVVGDALSDWLGARRPSFSETATMCEKIADALHHAHETGVIHRDLKPQNIIVDRQGEPRLTDFGLARRETGEVTMTVDGQVLGTPAYMSPEQAQGRSHQADRRSDIYSLGVVLFQMLTGEIPFRGSVHMLMHQIIHDDAPQPRRLNGHVPRDLETICLKCLEKSPKKRYQSADELAGELRRFRRGEPIQARALTRLGRTWRWCQRYPMAAIVISTALLLAIVGPLVAIKQARLAEENRRRLYAADMVVAQQAWEAANVGRIRQLLARHIPRPHQEDLRGFQWYYLWRLCQRGWEAPTLSRHQASIWSLAFSPDDKTLASCSGDGTIILWDAQTEEELAVLGSNLGHALSLAFAPDGRTIASTGGSDLKIRLWDIDRRELRREFRLQGDDWATCVAISPDGKLLAWGSFGGRVCICDFHTLQSQQTLEGQHAGWVTSLAFSADRQTLVSGSVDCTIGLWDIPTGQLRQQLRGHKSWVRGLAISPDGALIASASHDKTAKLWDLQSGELKRTLVGHRARLWSTAFSPDGNRVVTASSDGTVKLWDVIRGEELDSLIGHENPTILAVAYSSDGKTVASAGVGAKIKLWDVTTTSPKDTLEGHSQEVIWAAFSPDGKTLASASADTTVRLWDTTTGSPLSTLRGHASRIFCVAFSGDGKLLASVGDDATLKLWDATTGMPLRRQLPDLGSGPSMSVAFSADGKTLASGSYLGTITLWDMEARRTRATLAGHDGLVWPLAFSPDGKTLASGGYVDKTVRLWDVVTGQTKTILGEHEAAVYCVAFSRDGTALASGGEDTTVKLWDLATFKERETLREHAGEVRTVAFFPDSSTLVSGSSDTTIKLWYLGTGREPETLTGHQFGVSAVTISPDGQVLASAGEDNTIKLWRVAEKKDVRSKVWLP